MTIILNINSEKFSLNGIPYFKNFMPHVVAGKLKIVNVYDTSFELSGLDLYSNYSVDGVTYTSLAALQDALLPAIYTRNSLNFNSDLPFYNQIIKENGITSVGLNKTFLAGWEWLINNVQYSNVSDQTISFPLASSGKQRLDRVVATNLNTFVRIPGVESTSNAIAEPRPDNTIDVTFVLVSDSEVSDPAPPVVGDAYISKASKSFIRMYQTGDVDAYPVDDRTYLKFETGMLSLKSLSISLPSHLYHGKDFIFKNGTAGNVTLYHNLGSGNFKFNIPNGQNLVLKPEESVHFVMRAINSSESGGLLDYVGVIVDLSNKADLVGGKVPSSQLPSYVDDILEGYLLSNVFYVESSHTTVISAEVGKVYIDITSGQKNKQYRYSGSTYIQITNGLIASTDDVPEGSVNKYSTLTLVMSYVLTGISFATGTAIVSTDSILIAFGKLQKQITDIIASVLLKQDISNQIDVALPATVQNSWHGKTVKFTSSGLLTIPSSFTNSGMTFEGLTKAGVTLSWAITSPKTWEFGTPISVTEKQIFTFMQNDGLNTIMILGI